MGKYNNYTVQFKLKVVEYAEKNGNRAAEREYLVREKLVRDWRKLKGQLKNASMSRRAFRGPKTGKFPEIEGALLKYIEELRNDGFCVSHEMLQSKACEIAWQHNITSTEFKASRGWVARFMRRKNLSLRRRTPLRQMLPSDYTFKVVDFHRFIIQLRQENSYLLSQIGNAKHIPVSFDVSRNIPIHEKGGPSVFVKTTSKEKIWCTVMLAITADGQKLPPFVVFKRKTMPGKVKFPAGIHVRVQEKGYMDNVLMKDWIRTVWNRRTGSTAMEPALLVLDSFRGHLVDEVKKELEDAKTSLAIIPGGLTSILQPLDISVQKPFKRNLRRMCSDWMAGEKHETGGKVKRPSLELVCSWLVSSWHIITEKTISKSFKKTGISNSLDGSEDYAIWNDDSDTGDYSESESSDDELNC